MGEGNRENGLHLIQGVKSKNVSLKIMLVNDSRYLVERKAYFLSICFKKECFFYDSLQEAEDKYLLLRYGICKHI